MTPQPFARSLLPTSFLLVVLVVFSGCATKTYEVKVDAISKPKATEAVSYRIKNRNPAVAEDTLRYKEAAEHVKTALSGKGMYEAAENEQADVIVELDYGMHAPRVKMETVSVPVYARVGGGIRYEQVAVADRNGNVSYRTVAVFEPPRTELVGFDEVPRAVSVYEKFLKITARENGEVTEGRPPAEVWSVYVSSEDESRDLRKYLPIMASASIDYIGKDSENQQVVRVKDTSDSVAFVRRGINESATQVAAQQPPKI